MSNYLPGLFKDELPSDLYLAWKANIIEVLEGNRNLITSFPWMRTIQRFAWWSDQNVYQNTYGRISPEARKILETAIGRARKPIESDPEYEDLFI